MNKPNLFNNFPKPLALNLGLFMATFFLGAVANANPSHTSILNAEELPDLYTTYRPRWGIELSGASSNVGDRSVAVGAEHTNATQESFMLQLEYQPRFIQAIGVLGFG